jgi:hypothetical protein
LDEKFNGENSETAELRLARQTPMNWKVFDENKFSTTHKVIAWIILAIIVSSQVDVIIHLSLELLHILFEILESALDHLVEHIFHTDTRTTQVITFYLILTLAALASYMLIIMMPVWYRMIKYKIRNGYQQGSRIIFDFWQATYLANKAKWWTVLTVLSGILVLGLFS